MYDHYFSNFDRPHVPDDLYKDSTPRHSWFWRRRFLKVFTIYGHGGHLDQRTVTILAIFRSPNLRRPIWNLSKIGSEASEEKSFENVNARTDGRTDDRWKVITITHLDQSLGELKMFTPVNPFFLYMTLGLPGSSMNGLVNVMVKQRKKEGKKERKLTERKTEGRQEGHTASRNWILPVHSVGKFIQSKMR